MFYLASFWAIIISQRKSTQTQTVRLSMRSTARDRLDTGRPHVASVGSRFGPKPTAGRAGDRGLLASLRGHFRRWTCGHLGQQGLRRSLRLSGRCEILVWCRRCCCKGIRTYSNRRSHTEVHREHVNAKPSFPIVESTHDSMQMNTCRYLRPHGYKGQKSMEALSFEAFIHLLR